MSQIARAFCRAVSLVSLLGIPAGPVIALARTGSEGEQTMGLMSSSPMLAGLLISICALLNGLLWWWMADVHEYLANLSEQRGTRSSSKEDAVSPAQSRPSAEEASARGRSPWLE